jgi:hypothetical protein
MAQRGVGSIVRGWILIAVLAGSAHGTVLYSTFGLADEYDQSSGWTVGMESFNQAAAVFIPSRNATLDSIRVATFYVEGPNNFNVHIAPDAGGVPGAPLESFTGLSFAAAFSGPANILTLNSALNPALSAGTLYWVVMNTPDAPDAWGAWNVSNQGANGVYTNDIDLGFAWAFDAGDASPAIEVNGTTSPADTPEPGTLGTALAAIIFIAAMRCVNIPVVVPARLAERWLSGRKQRFAKPS